MGECMILRRNGAYTGTMAGQPLGFKAVSNRIGTIDLSWTTVPEDTAYAALRVVRRDDRFPKDEYDGKVIYEGPDSRCTDEGLTPGATYYYRAFARSKDGVYQNSYCQVTGTVRETQPLILMKVGDIVRIKENDAWQEYVVAHQGYPHRAGGNTLLLRRDVAGRRTIASTMKNEYDGSMADSWLSGAFLPTVDSAVSAKIPTCQIPYTGGGEHAPGYLQRQVFLLSATELGGGEAGMGTEGTLVDLFQTDEWRISNFQGAPYLWATRSPDTRGANQFWTVDTAGTFASKTVITTCGMRPAFTLPGDAFVVDMEGHLLEAPL